MTLALPSLKTILVAGLVSSAASQSLPAFAQGGSHADHSAHKEMMKSSANEVKTADVKLHNARVVDQNGESYNFAEDVVGEDIVVVDFIFTTCTTICPVTTALLSASRNQFKDLEDATYISISIDPNTDTPDRLAAFSETHNADWTFLTGEKVVIDQLLLDLDAYSTNPEDHAPMVLVGDGKTGKFIRMFGLPHPKLVKERVDYFRSVRQGYDHHTVHEIANGHAEHNTHAAHKTNQTNDHGMHHDH